MKRLRVISPRDRVDCNLCHVSNQDQTLATAENLKKHLITKHIDVIRRNAQERNVEVETSLNDIYLAHVTKNVKLPESVLRKQEKEAYEDRFANFVETSSNVQGDENVSSDLSSGSKTKSHGFSEVFDSNTSSIAYHSEDSNSSNSDVVTDSNTDAFGNSIDPSSNNVHESSEDRQHMSFNPDCLACIRMKSHHKMMVDFFKSHCQKAINEDCKCQDEKNCCCKQFFQSIVIFTNDHAICEPKAVTCKRRPSLKTSSKEHDEKIEEEKEEEEEEYGINQLSKDVMEKCTENLCLNAQFFCDKNLSDRVYPDMCLLVRKMTENISFDPDKCVSPLGNRSNNKMSIPPAKVACYNVVKENLFKRFNSQSVVTKDLPRFMIALDISTGVRDATRQVIVGSYINREGWPEDVMISAKAIPNQRSMSAANHVKVEVSQITDPQNIAVISTEESQIYSGENGMIGHLRKDNSFSSKIIYLPDFCYSVKRLMNCSEPDWVHNTMISCTWIVNTLSQHSRIISVLQGYENENLSSGVAFHVPQSMSETRYAEYHLYIHSVLRNVKIMSECLPMILHSSDDFDRMEITTASGILMLILDPSFIARLLLIDSIFVDVSIIEEETQDRSFGPVDYERVVTTLKHKLIQRKSRRCNDIDELMDNEEFNYKFRQSSLMKEFQVNLRVIQEQLDLPFSGSDVSSHALQNDYLMWIDTILEEFDNFLSVPESVQRVLNIFKLDSKLDVSEKVTLFRQLFSEMNVSFVSCGNSCLGIKSCRCVEVQLKVFLEHMNALQKSRNSNPSDATLKSNFAFYLAEENVVKTDKLNVTNVLRAIEIVQLMKSSQSSTKSVMLGLAKVVKGRYDIARVKTTKEDMVNVSVFLTFNSDITTLDTKLAREKYLESGHLDVLMKTKPLHLKSKTIKRMAKRPTKTAMRLRNKRKKHDASLDAEESIEEQVETHSPETSTENCEIESTESLIDIDGLPTTQDEVIKTRRDGAQYEEQSEDEAQSSSAKTTELLSVRRKSETKIKYLYCSCKGPVKNGIYIQCANKTNCVSYLERKETDNAEGGDWFHLACAGLSEKPKLKAKWRCHLCVSNQCFQ